MGAQASLVLDGTYAECGDSVTGTVSWSGNRGNKQVAVVLRYRTEGRGDTDSAVLARADLGTQEFGQARFSLTVPLIGPVSYNGNLIRLLWQVTAQIPAGRGGLAGQDVTIAPRRWSQLRPDG